MSDTVIYNVKPKQRVVERISGGATAEYSCDEMRAVIANQNRMGLPLLTWMVEADRACRAAGVTQAPIDKQSDSSAPDAEDETSEPIDPIFLAAAIVGGALLLKRLRK